MLVEVTMVVDHLNMENNYIKTITNYDVHFLKKNVKHQNWPHPSPTLDAELEDRVK